MNQSTNRLPGIYMHWIVTQGFLSLLKLFYDLYNTRQIWPACLFVLDFMWSSVNLLQRPLKCIFMLLHKHSLGWTHSFGWHVCVKASWLLVQDNKNWSVVIIQKVWKKLWTIHEDCLWIILQFSHITGIT